MSHRAESLYLYLTSDRSRATLRSVRTVVVDEIHALARDKRGSHFALSMERLERSPVSHCSALDSRRPHARLIAWRITSLVSRGRAARRARSCKSATFGPWELSLDAGRRALRGGDARDVGPGVDRLIALSATHRTMLVFTNTRRLAERVAHDVGERPGHDVVAAHHGGVAKNAPERRRPAQSGRPQDDGRDRVTGAGHRHRLVDLVVQLGSPRAITVMLQRLGRSGTASRQSARACSSR